MVDTMRIRMQPIPAGNEIYYYDRNNLIQIDEDAYAVEEGSVTVESASP